MQQCTHFRQSSHHQNNQICTDMQLILGGIFSCHASRAKNCWTQKKLARCHERSFTYTAVLIDINGQTDDETMPSSDALKHWRQCGCTTQMSAIPMTSASFQHTPGFAQNSVVFQTFAGQNYLFFADLSRHFVHLHVNKNTTKLAFKRWNFLYNVFFYSKYWMWLKFLNSELCFVMNCRKINKCMGNQQCNRHLHFPGQLYSFQRFFQTFPYIW